jgi:hypothetical protein
MEITLISRTNEGQKFLNENGDKYEYLKTVDEINHLVKIQSIRTAAIKFVNLERDKDFIVEID